MKLSSVIIGDTYVVRGHIVTALEFRSDDRVLVRFGRSWREECEAWELQAMPRDRPARKRLVDSP